MSTVFVALSTYNGGEYLRPLLESIRKQSYADWTLLVRDDGSQDQSVPQIREAAAADRRIIFWDDPHRYGASASFGRLMRHAYQAGAEYLLFADQDDIWFPDKVEKMLEVMRCGEFAAGCRLLHLTYSDLKVVDADVRPVHDSFLRHARLRHSEGRPLRILLGRSFVLGCACMVNRPLMEFALPLPSVVASHDWWMALCAASVGHISYLAEPTLLYRRHAKNTSGPAGFWKGFNPLRHSWGKRWKVGRESYQRSLDQARALRERLHERCPVDAEEAVGLLDRFCDLFERPLPAWRRVLELHRLGIPAVDIPRRILYDLCVLRSPK
jgi:rhamnosyltransferase